MRGLFKKRALFTYSLSTVVGKKFAASLQRLETICKYSTNTWKNSQFLHSCYTKFANFPLLIDKIRYFSKPDRRNSLFFSSNQQNELFFVHNQWNLRFFRSRLTKFEFFQKPLIKFTISLQQLDKLSISPKPMDKMRDLSTASWQSSQFFHTWSRKFPIFFSSDGQSSLIFSSNRQNSILLVPDHQNLKFFHSRLIKF